MEWWIQRDDEGGPVTGILGCHGFEAVLIRQSRHFEHDAACCSQAWADHAGACAAGRYAVGCASTYLCCIWAKDAIKGESVIPSHDKRRVIISNLHTFSCAICNLTRQQRPDPAAMRVEVKQRLACDYDAPAMLKPSYSSEKFILMQNTQSL